jgi:hypothetical protein
VTVADLTPGEHAVALESDRGSVKQIVLVEAGVTGSLMVPLGSPDGAPVSGWIAVTAPTDVQIFENHHLIGTSQSDRLMVVRPPRHRDRQRNARLSHRAHGAGRAGQGDANPDRLSERHHRTERRAMGRSVGRRRARSARRRSATSRSSSVRMKSSSAIRISASSATRQRSRSIHRRASAST